MLIDTDNVVCMTEIAEMAGVTPSAISNWRKRNVGFPQPIVTLRIGALWHRPDVEEWIAGRKAIHEQSKKRAITYHENKLRELRA